MKPQASCKNCTKRKVGCHDRCEEYQKFKKEMREWQEYLDKEYVQTRRILMIRRVKMLVNININDNKCNYVECVHYLEGECQDDAARNDCIDIAKGVLCIEEVNNE